MHWTDFFKFAVCSVCLYISGTRWHTLHIYLYFTLKIPPHNHQHQEINRNNTLDMTVDTQAFDLNGEKKSTCHVTLRLIDRLLLSTGLLMFDVL